MTETVPGWAPVTNSVLWDLTAEIDRQDRIHPDGYPPTRDGIRLGIAAAQDEIDETRDAWRAGRCKCPQPRCGHHDWSAVRVEALQAAAVLVRMARHIHSQPAEPEAYEAVRDEHPDREGDDGGWRLRRAGGERR